MESVAAQVKYFLNVLFWKIMGIIFKVCVAYFSDMPYLPKAVLT